MPRNACLPYPFYLWCFFVLSPALDLCCERGALERSDLRGMQSSPRGLRTILGIPGGGEEMQGAGLLFALLSG